jgi:predicted GNAT family acetyltransferase
MRQDQHVQTVVAPTLEQVLDFCAAEPVERVFLEDVARRRLGKFAAVEGDGDRLQALCHVGTNLVPSGRDCAAFAGVVRENAGRIRMVIGEERAVDELWDAAAGLLPEPRDDRPGQPVYELEERPPPAATMLRPAEPDDFDLLLPACARMHEEEVGIDPMQRDADGFRWRTRAQIDDGRSWLWVEDGRILFKAEASAWTPQAVQLMQVWVDPAVRGRGYAQRGLRDLCRLLLERTPRVCLFVRPENAAAIRVYEAVGMRRTISYRSLIF